jgi:hypothetical protein
VCKQLQLLNNCNHTLLPKYVANADLPLPCTALLVHSRVHYFAFIGSSVAAYSGQRCYIWEGAFVFSLAGAGFATEILLDLKKDFCTFLGCD